MKQTSESTGAMVIRPSMKLVRAGYWVVFFVFFASVLAYTNWGTGRIGAWILAVPALLFLWPVSCHMTRRFTHLTLDGGSLRFESGILTKSKRVIPISKVQDVRVVQRLAQRVLSTGDISIESAGETSLLTIQNVDNPDRVTDAIMKAAHLESGVRPDRA